MISDLFGVSGRRFLDALIAGERSPAALAALGDYRLKASKATLEEALTGQFRDIHATEIAMHLRLIDAINAEITVLDAEIEQLIPQVPRTAPVCTACGLVGGGHAPDCQDLASCCCGCRTASTRSPASARSTPGCSSPSSAPTPPRSPPPRTPPPGPS